MIKYIHVIKYNLNVIILILDLSVCVCVPYKQEMTGSHLTRAKKFLFLGTTGFGRYNTQPTDTASNGPSHD